MPNISSEVARRLRPNRPFHHPPSAQPLNSTVTLTLDGITDQPRVLLTDTRRDYTWQVYMSAAGEGGWEAEVRLPMAMTIVEYVFEAGGQTITDRRQNDGHQHSPNGNQPIFDEWLELPYKIAVYDPDRMPADWTKGMVVYQIFPDRFARAQSEAEARAAMKGVYGHEPQLRRWGDPPELPPLGRDFFGGDLRGIVEKLDYLDELGVECIYLNPIFEAASNHRYEAIDFMKIDRMLGPDFDRLIEEAHRRDIKIVLDAVFNHCSSDSVYFDITGQFGSGASQSPESPYYRWFNFQHWPDQYDGWHGLGFMPEFVECPEMEKYFLGPDGVTAYWLEKGIDGWRADVPFDNTEVFWQRFRQRVDAVKPEAWTIAEEWDDATDYLLGDMFNATMNYRFTWAVRGFFAQDRLTAAEFDDRLQVWLRDTPAPAIPAQMNLLDSHDTDRLLTVCGGDRDRYKQCVAFQFAYPGAPTVFYGGETGLEGTNPEDGRRCMPWDNLDPDLGAFFRQVMTCRKTTPVLRTGDTVTLLVDDTRRLYAFARRLDDDIVYALFNAGAAPATMTVSLLVDADGIWHDVLNNQTDATAAGGVLTAILPARGFAYYAR